MIDASIVDAVGAFDGRGQHAYDGAFSAAGWLAGRAGITRAAASATVKTARQARHMPKTTAAARSGDLGFDKMRVLAEARAMSEATAAAFDDDEARLVAEVSRHPVEAGGRLMRNWAAAADPDADEARHRDAEARRKVNLSTSLEGMGFLDGLLTTEANAVVDAQLEAITDDLHRNGLSVDAAGKRLTAAQLRHDALVEMAHRAGASGTIVDVRRDAQRRAQHEAAAHSAEAHTDTDTVCTMGSSRHVRPDAACRRLGAARKGRSDRCGGPRATAPTGADRAQSSTTTRLTSANAPSPSNS